MLTKLLSPTMGIAAVAALAVASPAHGQEAPRAAPEVIPAPAPSPPAPEADPGAARAPRAVRAPETYDSLQAGRDAHAMAERQRRGAIDRQLQTIETVQWYNAWYDNWYDAWGRHYARHYALPYIYAYAPPFAARQAHWAIEGYVPAPPFSPWPFVPGDIYGYRYVPRVEQPEGHEKIWTGPNSYVYRPRYQEPPPEVSPPAPIPQVPPKVTGPREF